MKGTIRLNRRQFIKAGLATAGGLTLGVYFGKALADDAAAALVDAAATPLAPTSQPHAFIRINEDNTVTVIMKHLEMGQGSHTGLATLAADEMDADWAQIRTETAPADGPTYKNLAFGPLNVQGTGGSNALSNSFMQMREVGAAAKAMLVAAAAQAWDVPADEIMVNKGVLSHDSGEEATFGEMASAAAEQEVPTHVTLKTPEQFVYIGKGPMLRVDTNIKTNGTAQYTQDVQLPDMVTAVVAHPPLFGATPASVDDSAATAIEGVLEVVTVPMGVAVLAEDFWSAKQGRDALKIEWDDSNAYKRSSDEQMAIYRDMAVEPGLPAREEGDPVAALEDATTVVEASYEFPYLAHAAMEPMNCVVHLHEDGCDVWNGDQMPSLDQAVVAHIMGLDPTKVNVHTLYAGGSFGRRGNPNSDYIVEAALIAKTSELGRPVKMVWTREEDMQAGYYRPMFYHKLSGGLDEEGALTAWHQIIAGQSIMMGTPFEMMVQNGIDAASVGGSGEPYTIPNLRVGLHTPDDVNVPVQWWRSVEHTHTGYATECFIDELAAAADADPVEFRKAMLQDHPRYLQVLELAAEKSGWGSELPENKGRGVALVESFNTYVAEVAEVTVKDDGSFSVDKVTVAVDCGVPVNPDVIEAQMMGGVGFALSAALGEKITLKDGKVEQSNFHNYPIMRMSQMPEVEVHIVPSTDPPSGVGEPAVPPLAPAVANALFAATGKRIRELPFGTNI